MAATYIGAGAQSGNTSTDTTRDIAYPSGIQADDQLVMILTGSSANQMNNPAGWTQLVNTLAGGLSPSLYVGRKTATGSETGNQTVTSSGSAVVQGRMFLIRGVDTTTPLDVAVSVYSNATSANPYAITGVTTTIAGAALIVAGAGNSTTITGTSAVAATAGALTEVDDRSWRTIASYVLDWSGSGATGNVDLTWSAGSRGAAALIALRPAAGTTAISKDLDARWHVRSAAAKTIDLRWHIRGVVTRPVDLRWHIAGIATVYPDLRWHVRNIASAQRDLRWHIQSATGQQLDTRWHVAAPLSRDVDLRWHVRSTAAGQLDGRWHVAAALDRELDARWHVRAATSRNLDLRWHVAVLPAPTITHPTLAITANRAALGLAVNHATLQLAANPARLTTGD